MLRRLRVMIPLLLAMLATSQGAFASEPITVTILGAEQAAGNVWDVGSITLAVNGYAVTVAYGQFSSASAVASGIAAKFSQNCSGPAVAKANGASISFRARASTSGVTSISATEAFDSGHFQHASFYLNGNQGPGGSQTIGNTPPPLGTQLYSYSITDANGNSGYQANGNVAAYTDSVNGRWQMSYDNLNRLVTADPSTVTAQNQHLCWSYDSFGNRTTQQASAQGFQNISNCTPQGQAVPPAITYDANNHITFAPGLPASYAYDGAGNVTDDGMNQLLYDAEGRICASSSRAGGPWTGYLYDAEGNRVGKGTLSSFTCDMSPSNFTLTSEYVPGPSGEQMTEIDGQGNWVHTNVYVAGQLIATYANDGKGVHFHLSDWLGTRRVQTDYVGNPEIGCTSNPFGDPSPSSCTTLITGAADITEQHFTGKERDTESGLDYFGARYYSSSMGRFMSPDWAAKPISVPYAAFGDPQTLNLYSYVENGPINKVDADGHAADPTISANWGAVDLASCDGNQACIFNSLASNVGSDQWRELEKYQEAVYDAQVRQAFAATGQSTQQQSESVSATGDAPKQPNTKPGPAPQNPDGSPQAPPIPAPKDVNGNPTNWKSIPGSGPKGGRRWIPDGKVPSPNGKGGGPQVVWDPEDGYWTHDNGAGTRTHWGVDGNQVIKATAVVGAAAGATAIIMEILEGAAILAVF